MPYGEEDAAFFFGREREREVISANLMASRLTLLYGPSGVGKSSVLNAGVVHHLRALARQTQVEQGTPELAVAIFNSWRDDPVAGLRGRCLRTVSLTVEGWVGRQPTPLSLADTVAACADRVGGDLLIILDQFEEYFLYHADEDGDGTFAVEFPRVVNRADLRVSFLVSIREDALAKLDRFKGRIPHLFDNYLRIEHLDRDAARAAIEGPLARYNELGAGESPVAIEPALVDAVLDQVRTGHVALGDVGRGVVAGASGAGDTARIETPYLQLVMTRLWREEMKARSLTLRHQTLTRLGGAQRIVRTHLDEAMTALAPAEQDTAARIFHYLVTPSGTKIAHTARDLASYAELTASQVSPVLERLAGPGVRILRPVPAPPGEAAAPRFEIFHDVLAPAVLDWRSRAAQTEERGLEAFRGRIWPVGRVLAAGVIVLTGPLVLAMGAYDMALSPLPAWQIAAVTSTGFLVVLAGMILTMRAAVHGGRAAARGFGWLAVLEAIADRRGDGAALLAGTREYAAASADVRRDARVLRLVAAGLSLLAIVAPLFALLAVMHLGARHLIAPVEVLPLTFVPTGLLFAIAGMAVLRERWLLRQALGARKRSDVTPRRAGVVSALGRGLESLQVRHGAAEAQTGGRGAGWVLGIAMVLPVLVAAAAIAGVMAVVAGGEVMYFATIPQYDNVDDRLRDVEPGRPYRLPADPGITVQQATDAYARVLTAQVASSPSPLLRPAQRQEARRWLPDRHPFGERDASQAALTLISRAAAGFSGDELAYLDAVAANPALRDVAVAARARALDAPAGHLRLPLPTDVTIFELPLLPLVGVADVARAGAARAALELARGRSAEAEHALREAISFGFAMIDNGTFLVDTFMGVRVADIGLRQLEVFYRATGRRREAQELSAALTPTARADGSDSPRRQGPVRALDMSALRQVVLDVVGSSRHPRGYRQEMLDVAALMPCTNVGELIFGPRADMTDAVRRFRRDLVRFPGEAAVFEMVLQTLDRLPHYFSAGPRSSGSPAPATSFRTTRAVAAAFGNPRLAACGMLVYRALSGSERPW